MEILESTTDAKGRKLEVIKVPCPPPMFRTHHEADTVDVSAPPHGRLASLLAGQPKEHAAAVLVADGDEWPLAGPLMCCCAACTDFVHLHPLVAGCPCCRSCCPLQPEHITKGYVPRLANARLPGSYINHYCANGGVVVPQFGYPTDQQAIDALQKAYGPGYKVVGVPGGTREVLLNAGETGAGWLAVQGWGRCTGPLAAPAWPQVN